MSVSSSANKHLNRVKNKILKRAQDDSNSNHNNNDNNNNDNSNHGYR